MRFYPKSSETQPVQIERRSGRRLRDTLTEGYNSDSSLEREASHHLPEHPAEALRHMDDHEYTQTAHSMSAEEMGLPSVPAERASRERPQLGIADRAALTAQISGEIRAQMRDPSCTAHLAAKLDH